MKSKTKKNSTQVIETKQVLAEEEEPIKSDNETEIKKKKNKKNKLKKQIESDEEEAVKEDKKEEKEIPEGELTQIVEPIKRVRRPRKVKEPKLSKQELMCQNFEQEEREAQKQRLAATAVKNETFLTKKKILIAAFFAFLFLVRLFKVFFK